MIIDGKDRNMSSRKYCISCSPFLNHNTSKLEKYMYINLDSQVKECGNCHKIKPISEFHYQKDRKRGYFYCKICANKLTIERLKRNKIEAVMLKGGKCEVCEYNKCIDALEFHHTNQDEKDIYFRNMRSWGKARRLKELEKCILVCSNCHREIHSKNADMV